MIHHSTFWTTVSADRLNARNGSVATPVLSAALSSNDRVGSASRAAAASSTEPPGTIWSATDAISDSMRASSSNPHAYVSSRSTLAPRKYRDHRAYSSRPTASDSRAAGSSSSRR